MERPEERIMRPPDLPTQYLVDGGMPREMTETERAAAIAAGAGFAKAIADHGSPGPCLVIAGRFMSAGQSTIDPADEQVKRCCFAVFGYPDQPHSESPRINVLLDSDGGHLDSAFKIIRYLDWYASEVNVYVPRKAKSASTLLALGAHRIHLSPFGELGPLDAQIRNPRKPNEYVSALDCYQSVDHVRRFGIATMRQALSALGDEAGRSSAFSDALNAASSFAVGAIQPMLERIIALDFGSWGRSLEIGEKYARQILKDNKDIIDADRMLDPSIGEAELEDASDPPRTVARRLVYEYQHHDYPIDYREARSIGLTVEMMSRKVYEAALPVLEKCEGKSFVDFVSEDERKRRNEKHHQGSRRLHPLQGHRSASRN